MAVRGITVDGSPSSWILLSNLS